MLRILIAVFVLITLGCSGGRVEKDDRPSFRIDPAQPFRIEFGRGSGWHGLDTIKIDQGGAVVLHRMKEAKAYAFETATLQLPPDTVADVLKAIDTNDLLSLHKAYHADMHDGTQWILWIKQGEREKSVYFNNSFPSQITPFAERIDGILAGG